MSTVDRPSPAGSRDYLGAYTVVLNLAYKPYSDRSIWFSLDVNESYVNSNLLLRPWKEFRGPRFTGLSSYISSHMI